MYKVSKHIYFCYGHRLLNYQGKCSHPHGHNGKIEIELRAEMLDKRSMVCDFGDMKKIIQEWIDKNLDHKMILKKGDPILPVLKKMKEPYFEMKDNPTAEAIAKLVFDYARSKKLPVTKITFWETNDSCATFEGS